MFVFYSEQDVYLPQKYVQSFHERRQCQNQSSKAGFRQAGNSRLRSYTLLAKLKKLNSQYHCNINTPLIHNNNQTHYNYIFVLYNDQER